MGVGCVGVGGGNGDGEEVVVVVVVVVWVVVVVVVDEGDEARRHDATHWPSRASRCQLFRTEHEGNRARCAQSTRRNLLNDTSRSWFWQHVKARTRRIQGFRPLDV